MSKIQKIELDEVELRAAVERLLGERFHRLVEVASLKRDASPFSTLFPAEVLSLELRDGETMSLFLKHLGSEQSDHPEKQCREREIRIYQDLFSENGLPVPKYYGSRWNEATGRRELFLEYVDDWNLKYQDLEHWFAAARSLARLHGYFSTRVEKLLRCDFLLRFDAVYFHAWANRALAAVADQSADLATRLESIVDRYDRIARTLEGQAPTLVHNDLSPKNVLVDRSAQPPRIFFVDWEMAGVGCGVLDLVHLKYGFERQDEEKMCAEYCGELAGMDFLPSSPADLNRLLAAAELHKTLYRLAHSLEWKLPIETVARWVSDTQELFDRV